MIANPFHDLYLSEAIPEEALVELFSPIIVKYASAIFEPGNVIIRGLQGTGKTMLLNLLRPESRIAYRRSRRNSFPVPEESWRFIGAGINLRKCGALEFAQHLTQESDARQIQELELLFGDFVNYLIVADLVSSIDQFLRFNDGELLAEIGINGQKDRLDTFSQILASDPCWFDALEGVKTIEQLRERLSERLKLYRRFLNLNIDELPKEVIETKTIIGSPILKAAEALRASGVLSADTKVFIRIDQYEQLPTLDVMGTNYGSRCQELIHKALAARDARVSYRIGTRTHGWPDRPQIYRTTDVLELKRDFNIIDIDEIFRRRENVRTWAFPGFARDIFARRLKVSALNTRMPAGDYSIVGALGRSLGPRECAHQYVSTDIGRNRIIEKAVNALPHQASQEWKDYIISLGNTDLLSAWLSCAWVRQKIVVRKNRVPLGSPPKLPALPWENKPYWFKERVQIGLLQIASENRQKLMWSGEDDVLNLSGGQILVFLFVLQHIWDAWLRDKRGAAESDFRFPIEHEVQSQGILEASIEWRSKQIEGHNAFERKTFVDELGKHFYVKLTNDLAMSYPGANGFSISNKDLELDQNTTAFLRQAVGFGDLYEFPHTSKTKGERRTKYYLAPILSPYFRIPSVHTKEPEYVTIKEVHMWRPGKIALAEMQIGAQGSLWDEETYE